MKSFIIAVCMFACVYANAVDQAAQILRQEYNQEPEGNYAYGYETDNGISGQAQGVVKSVGKDESALEVQGSNSFKSPEGDVYTLTYIANEFGYQPQGDHLPTAPPPEPIPEYILKALEYIRTNPYTEKQ